ncbi:MAG: uroporphyrinogen decarboxylase family protein [Clostridia bacterium]
MNMYKWIDKMIFDEEKMAFPLLSFPAVQLLFVTVKELIESSNYQAMGMKMITDKYDMPAAISFMDLSVEAEAFGARTVYAADEVPTITGQLVASEADVQALRSPHVGDGRTGVCVESIKKALRLITDRPVFANCIGPFSLTGRLMNVNEVMISCYDEPEFVHKVLRKVTDFLIEYALAFKAAGAHGIILAEPLAGMLSPTLMQMFSTGYIQELVGRVQDEKFIVIYHNCGSSVNRLVDEIVDTGCRAFHFGDAVDMHEMLEKMPKDCLVMGNISPSKHFLGGTPQSVRNKTERLLRTCADYHNFIISSGCDIPPLTDLENVNVFFETVQSFYYRRKLMDLIA